MMAMGRPAFSMSDRASLRLLQRGRDWIWIAGNHDPEPAAGVGGSSAAALAIGALSFCHQPQAERRRARSPVTCIRWRA